MNNMKVLAAQYFSREYAKIKARPICYSNLKALVCLTLA